MAKVLSSEFLSSSNNSVPNKRKSLAVGNLQLDYRMKEIIGEANREKNNTINTSQHSMEETISVYSHGRRLQ